MAEVASWSGASSPAEHPYLYVLRFASDVLRRGDPRDLDRGVDVDDLHRAVAPIEEAVGDARRDVGGLVGTKLVETAVDLGGRFALDHRDRLFAIVRVELQAGAWLDRCHAGQQAFRADLSSDEVERLDAGIRLPGVGILMTNDRHRPLSFTTSRVVRCGRDPDAETCQ